MEVGCVGWGELSHVQKGLPQSQKKLSCLAKGCRSWRWNFSSGPQNDLVLGIWEPAAPHPLGLIYHFRSFTGFQLIPSFSFINLFLLLFSFKALMFLFLTSSITCLFHSFYSLFERSLETSAPPALPPQPTGGWGGAGDRVSHRWPMTDQSCLRNKTP